MHDMAIEIRTDWICFELLPLKKLAEITLDSSNRFKNIEKHI